MKKGIALIAAILLAAASVPALAADAEAEAVTMDAMNKKVRVEAELCVSPTLSGQMNPLITTRYSADPTSVEHNGRVYVFSTNDDQQYQATPDAENSYQAINTLNVFSSADLVNWTDHGYIDVKAVSPRIRTSWAPSIVKRVEEDGLTHFYLFYAEDGWATGVLTATDPLGPWTDPLSKAVVTPYHPKVKGKMVNCFDPGAYCDEDGTIYLSCGGGKATDDPAVPMSSAILQLDDNLQIVGEPYVLSAPYFFEASELNKIGKYYVYTFNSDWSTKLIPVEGYIKSPTCSMEYMVSENPMGPYTYVSWYLRNPGEAGFYWGNNHTHLQEFKGKWYIFSHTRMLEQALGIEKGYRSVMVDEINITVDDENGVKIEQKKISKKGAAQVEYLNPYAITEAATICQQAGIMTRMTGKLGETVVTDIHPGDWIRVKGVDFGSEGAVRFTGKVKGAGVVDIRLDDVNSETVGSIDFDTQIFAWVTNSIDTITGVHDVYFVFGGEGWEFDSWQFGKE